MGQPPLRTQERIGPAASSPWDQRHWLAGGTTRIVAAVLEFLIGRPKLNLLIDGETVRCPLRAKDVDLERCASCQWLERVDREDGTIVCRPILDRFGSAIS